MDRQYFNIVEIEAGVPSQLLDGFGFSPHVDRRLLRWPQQCGSFVCLEHPEVLSQGFDSDQATWRQQGGQPSIADTMPQMLFVQGPEEAKFSGQKFFGFRTERLAAVFQNAVEFFQP